MRLYLDGALVNSLAISRTIATSLASLRIGHFEAEWFTGSIDEVRIYSRPLTDEEIASVALGNIAKLDQGNSRAAIGTNNLTYGLYTSEVSVIAVSYQEIVNPRSVDGASGGMPPWVLVVMTAAIGIPACVRSMSSSRWERGRRGFRRASSRQPSHLSEGEQGAMFGL